MQSNQCIIMSKHVMKTMHSIVLNHGPNTTHLAPMEIVGYSTKVYGLSTKGAISRHLIIPMTVW